MGEKIFIIDDDDHILKTYRRVLRDEPYDCMYFSSPVKALASAAHFEPAVVISDQQMPEMTGTELFSKIKTILPIASRVIVTGVADIDTAIHSINRGHVYRFIKKPWEDTWLKVEIKRALQYYHMNQRLQLLSECTMDDGVMERERLRGVLEMAGAVCHEFAQPLQTISGYCSLLMPETEGDCPDKLYLQRIEKEVQRLGDLLLKIMSIGEYRTHCYLGDQRMIDIDAASRTQSPFQLFKLMREATEEKGRVKEE